MVVSSNHVIADALAAEAGMAWAMGGIDAINIIAFQELSKDRGREERRRQWCRGCIPGTATGVLVVVILY